MNIKDLIEAVKFQVSVKPQDEFMREVAEGLKQLYEENTSQKAKIEALQMDNSQLQSDIIMANQNYEHMKGFFEQSQNVKRRAIQRFI